MNSYRFPCSKGITGKRGSSVAFFDDLGKKLSQAGQSAVQKTKDMTDIARMNAAITEEEKKIDAHYYQIGKLYAVLHAKDPESEFAGAVKAILDSARKIAEYRKEIQDIRGIVVCEKCGAQIPDQASFCNVCGTPLAGKSPEDAGVVCAGCGKVVPKGTRFCSHCGLPAAPAPESAPEITPNARLCPQCGSAMEADMAFCSECGTKLD